MLKLGVVRLYNALIQSQCINNSGWHVLSLEKKYGHHSAVDGGGGQCIVAT